MSETLLHTRNIQIDVYAQGDNRLLLKGRLTDLRHRQSDAEGKLTEVNRVIHDMNLRLTVKLPEAVIVSAEAAMDTIPYPGTDETGGESCRDTLSAVEKLVGLTITRGFSSKVREIMSDITSCAHLTTLALTTAPLTFQGMGALMRAQGAKLPRPLKRLLNTCYMWRAHGSLSRLFRVEESANQTRREAAGRSAT